MIARHLSDTLLMSYALGELEGEEQAAAAAHIETCAACCEMARRLGAALRAYREAPLSEAPPRVLVGLLEAQAAGRGWEVRSGLALTRLWWRRVPLARAAAVALMMMAVTFGAGFWVGHRSGETAAPAEYEAISPPAPRVRLPDAPSIAFQATPPLDAWVASPAAFNLMVQRGSK